MPTGSSTGRRRIVRAALAVALALGAAYAVALVARSHGLYARVKGAEHGWVGRVFVADAALGYAPRPRSVSAELVPGLPRVPVCFDERGFRVDPSAARARGARRPRLLALGCSFTHGSACAAGDTWPQLLGDELGSEVLNAGVPAYGLAQMVVLARRLVPEHRPALVVAQYSPWLAERARCPVARTVDGRVSVPFVYETADGRLDVHAPLFRTVHFDYRLDTFRGTPRGLADFVRFALRVGIPKLAREDVQAVRSALRRALRRDPRLLPPAREAEIVEWAYREIARVCEENGARLAILAVGEPALGRGPRVLYGLQDVAVLVNGHRRLMDQLEEPSQREYNLQYGHWAGQPPRLVDTHPNARAHRLLADALYDALRAR